MNDFPLHAFLVSLAADDIVLSGQDYDRILLTLQTGGTWTITRLKNILLTVIAENEDQQKIISRRFDKFFHKPDMEKKLPELNIQQVLRDLRTSLPESPPMPEAPDQAPDREESEPPKRYALKYGWWVLLAVILIFNLIANKQGLLNRDSDQQQADVPKPALKLNCHVLDFDFLLADNTGQQEIILENKGKSPLIIEQLTINGENPDVFKIPEIALPKIIPVEKKLIIPVIFVPTSADTFTADLEIVHNADKGHSDKISLRGTGK